MLPRINKEERDRAGVPHGKIYDSKQEAESDAAKLSKVNPVGFVVHEWDVERRDRADSRP